MKFTVSSTELLSHLQGISRVINSKNTLQILDNFLLDLQGNKLTMTASDIETTMITSMEVADVEGGGTVAIANKLILDTLRDFSEQPLTFHIDDETLAIMLTSSNGTYNLVGQNGDQYPMLPTLSENVRSFTVGANVLLSGISKTHFCMADDELRPVMNGILFDVSSNLTLVATDAHKLVRFITKYEEASVGEGETMSFVLPKKPANMLRNVLPKENGNVTVKFDEKNAYFQLENYTVVCRQVEGNYPNYNRVIPTNNPYRILVDRVVLQNALKRVSVFSNQASNLVKLDFHNNKVHISAQDIDFSISAEEVHECSFDGEPVKIGFKSLFLIEMLSNLESKEVVIELADPSRSGIILPFENDDDTDILMLLMPMLLND